ncbi:hypothetical protein Mapa_012200 [Marchantia paleacea]|nr:hypothetical protein Mapa_012200 [Marchantia paleacea]
MSMPIRTARILESQMTLLQHQDLHVNDQINYLSITTASNMNKLEIRDKTMIVSINLVLAKDEYLSNMNICRDPRRVPSVTKVVTVVKVVATDSRSCKP